jgi:hypothetical protein
MRQLMVMKRVGTFAARKYRGRRSASRHRPGCLELPADRALGFYAIVAAATLGGGALAATNIDPIAILFWTAVINGFVAVPIMVAMMLVVSTAKGRGAIALPQWVKIGSLAWLSLF